MKDTDTLSHALWVQVWAMVNALDGTRETLIPLWVVVLETNLELDSLDKVTSLLAVGIGEELLDRAPHA